MIAVYANNLKESKASMLTIIIIALSLLLMTGALVANRRSHPGV
jgi:hypothetical protein